MQVITMKGIIFLKIEKGELRFAFLFSNNRLITIILQLTLRAYLQTFYRGTKSLASRLLVNL